MYSDTRSVLPSLKSDAHELIVSFIRERVRSSGASGAVVAVSGGIDSALTLKLCADALGPNSVHAVLMPDGEWDGKDEQDATAFAGELGVHLHRFVIKDVVAGFVSLLNTDDRKILGNVKARIRMLLNYAVANKNRLLVIGTSNKSELLTGYYTKYGDGGSDICPIGDLYKTGVRELAAKLGIPGPILDKAPTAGLWAGQTDEGEMGLTYSELDEVLYALEAGVEPGSIASRTKIPGDKVEKVLSMIKASAHKRSIPAIPKIGIRTVGIDWNI